MPLISTEGKSLPPQNTKTVLDTNQNVDAMLNIFESLASSAKGVRQKYIGYVEQNSSDKADELLANL